MSSSRRDHVKARKGRRCGVGSPWRAQAARPRGGNGQDRALCSRMVGVRGFEPPTPSSRTRCATRLRYTPTWRAEAAERPYRGAACGAQARFLSAAAKRLARKSLALALSPVRGEAKLAADGSSRASRDPKTAIGQVSRRRRQGALMSFRLKTIALRRDFGRSGRRGARGRSQGRADPRPDRPARGLRQADRDRLHAGPRIRDQGHDDGRRPQDRRHHQGRPGQARPRQERARPRPIEDDGADIADRHDLVAGDHRRCCRSPRSTRRS